MISIGKRKCTVASLLIVTSFAPWGMAQKLPGVVSTNAPAKTATSTAVDPLGRDTPRNAMRNFLEACHQQRFERAAEYLDLSKLSKRQRAAKGPELARDLQIVLDHNTQFELGKLNNTPTGTPGESLPADMELLQTFDLDGQPYPLYLQRVMQNGVEVWLVSSDSVAKIAELSALIQPSKIEKILPEPLVKIAFLGTPLWTWIALVLIALILSALSRLLSRAAIAVAKPIVHRFAKSSHLYRWETFVEPIRLLVSVAVFRACIAFVAPSALLRDYLLKLLLGLAVFGAAALVMRFVDVISDRITGRLDPTQRSLSFSVLPLGVRFVKICIFCFAILVILAGWGYNTSAILAGLGVGGLAVALAAQKTIENLFGGISVISDRPVLVGDACQFGGQSGTVEDIGLRSTRVRTTDRTVLTIPNSQFSTMTIENFSRRDRMWFHPTLKLRRGTTPEEIRRVMDAVAEILKDHEKVDSTDVPVRFTKINLDSFDLEVFSYVLTADYNEFLRVQTELLLKIVEKLADLDVFLAVPITESVVTSSDGDPDKSYRALKLWHESAGVGNSKQG
jgi:MscS family membrane protein